MKYEIFGQKGDKMKFLRFSSIFISKSIQILFLFKIILNEWFLSNTHTKILR